MTQKEMVAQLLRTRGSVHTFELRRGDAGEFIGNPSQRIAELEKDGWTIVHERQKLHGKAMGSRYRLVSAPVVPEEVIDPTKGYGAGEPVQQLFDPEPVSTSHYREDAA